MSGYYCTHCGAALGDQTGFDPDAGCWTCTECGQFLTDLEDADLKIGWIVKEDTVDSLTIDCKNDFRRTGRLRIDAHIAISYHTFMNKKMHDVKFF